VPHFTADAPVFRRLMRLNAAGAPGLAAGAPVLCSRYAQFLGA